MPNGDDAPDMNTPQPRIQRGSPADFFPPSPLSAYRTVMAARGLRDINDRLAEGWELIMGEFCEEVLARSPTSKLPTSTTYRPYALLGKRDPLVTTDRAALADAEERAAEQAAIPLAATAPDAAPPTEPQAVTEGQPPEPMGSLVTPHRTVDAGRDKFEPIGGARNR
jgi:hypothetical protein